LGTEAGAWVDGQAVVVVEERLAAIYELPAVKTIQFRNGFLFLN
jgi:hypothetical protein